MESRVSGIYMNELFAWLYDNTPMYVSREDVGFFVDEAVASGGPVLELGCGTGRVLLPVARANIEVTGLDCAEPMVARLEEKLAREPEEVQGRVRIARADMRDFDLGRQFRLVMIPFRPFQHLITVDEQMACLGCIRRHLSPNGRLVFDCFHPDLRKLTDPAGFEEAEEFSGHKLPDGRLLRRTHRFAARHVAEQYNDVEIIHHLTDAEGRTERVVQAFPFRYCFRYEVEHLLARCGFRLVELFGNFDRSPFADESPQMIFIAERAAAGE